MNLSLRTLALLCLVWTCTWSLPTNLEDLFPAGPVQQPPAPSQTDSSTSVSNLQPANLSSLGTQSHNLSDGQLVHALPPPLYHILAGVSDYRTDVGACDLQERIYDYTMARLENFTGSCKGSFHTQDLEVSFEIKGHWGILYDQYGEKELVREATVRRLLVHAIVAVLETVSGPSNYPVYTDCSDNGVYGSNPSTIYPYFCSDNSVAECSSTPTGCGWKDTKPCPQTCRDVAAPCHRELAGRLLPSELTVVIYNRGSPTANELTFTVNSKIIHKEQPCSIWLRMVYVSLNFIPMPDSFIKSMLYITCTMQDQAQFKQANPQ
ncbi:hypothetical protein BCR37DRAFT_388026 [Protomyces lactucae-debilis]|uniref:Uncharacterized protein n=1 Tax=Protomyces lactucae-debilis TaxID=2754530 RepID=A0A1Y2FAU7_PROLT|nr:uncharacterized protein BCR37DRAFT_388026 [Protomyces lactucae-debilis]ORY81011.1 hypothetical protein BCR37DRAFT_388026 [Protomyces lactucae-debilis]